MNENDVIKKMHDFSLEEREDFRNFLNTNVEKLDISVRDFDTLIFNKITTIAMLLGYDEDKLKGYFDFNDKIFLDFEMIVSNYLKFNDFPFNLVFGIDYLNLLDTVEETKITVDGALYLIKNLETKVSELDVAENFGKDFLNLKSYVGKLRKN